jgi:hypothetical protein
MTNWDEEIDDVARQMTAGEPDASLKARVLARIDTVDSGRRSGWSMWTWSPVALVAALVAVVIVLAPWKSAKQGPVGMTADKQIEATPLAPASDGHTGLTDDHDGLKGIRPNRPSYAGRGLSGPASERVAFAGALVASDESDSLEPQLIEIEPIGVESMEAMESIQVPALASARIEVPAIGEE